MIFFLLGLEVKRMCVYLVAHCVGKPINCNLGELAAIFCSLPTKYVHNLS